MKTFNLTNIKAKRVKPTMRLAREEVIAKVAKYKQGKCPTLGYNSQRPKINKNK
jgi:hypothetical protein